MGVCVNRIGTESTLDIKIDIDKEAVDKFLEEQFANVKRFQNQFKNMYSIPPGYGAGGVGGGPAPANNNSPNPTSRALAGVSQGFGLFNKTANTFTKTFSAFSQQTIQVNRFLYGMGRTVMTNLFKLGFGGGGVAFGGLYALNKVTSSGADARFRAMGLGDTAGRVAAARNSFARFGDVDSQLDAIMRARATPGGKIAQRNLGLNDNQIATMSPGDILAATMPNAEKFAKETPLDKLEPRARATHIEEIYDIPALMRLREAQEGEVKQQQEIYVQQRKNLDITDKTLRSMSDFQTALGNAKDEIKKIFIDELEDMDPGLKHFKEALNDAVGVFHGLFDAIRAFMKWLGTDHGGVNPFSTKDNPYLPGSTAPGGGKHGSGHWGGAARGVGGGAKGGPGIAYSAKSMLEGTGFSQQQYDAFRAGVRDIEGGDYKVTNSGGYMGAYQMGPNEVKHAAMRLGIDPDAALKSFIKYPELQEKLFENYTREHYDQMMKNPQFAALSSEEKLAVLGAGQLGIGGSTHVLHGDRTWTIGRNPPAMTWADAVRRRLAKIRSDAILKPLPIPGAQPTGTLPKVPAIGSKYVAPPRPPGGDHINSGEDGDVWVGKYGRVIPGQGSHPYGVTVPKSAKPPAITLPDINQGVPDEWKKKSSDKTSMNMNDHSHFQMEKATRIHVNNPAGASIQVQSAMLGAVKGSFA